MEPKKISFGFSKTTKSTPLISNSNASKKPNVELIHCVEGQEIKIIGNEFKEEKLLVIPLLGNTKTSSALAALKTLKETLEGKDNEEVVAKSTSDGDGVKFENLTLEQKAAHEILASLKEADVAQNQTKVFSLPIKADEISLKGAKESTAEEYESIPIADFGLAMLRGMGWVDKSDKGKDKNNGPIDDGPAVRPKGMGLGADKMIKSKPLLVAPGQNETLEIKKDAFIRILAGKYKDSYGQIEGLDDHAGRVIIKLALGGTRESLNEFMVQPVTKQEYCQYGKVINSAKYEEYKSKQDSKINNIEDDTGSQSSVNGSIKDSNSRKNLENIHHDDESFNKNEPSRNSSYDRNRSKIKYRDKSRNNKHSKNYSSDSSSYESRRNSSKSLRKSKKKHSSRSMDRKQYSSESSDTDKHHYKKKTKKSKRQRSRSRSRR